MKRPGSFIMGAIVRDLPAKTGCMPALYSVTSNIDLYCRFWHLILLLVSSFGTAAAKDIQIVLLRGSLLGYLGPYPLPILAECWVISGLPSIVAPPSLVVPLRLWVGLP